MLVVCLTRVLVVVLSNLLFASHSQCLLRCAALWVPVQVGAATAIGEQPIKGLVDPRCGARMSVAESLTNLIFARISDLKVYLIFYS